MHDWPQLLTITGVLFLSVISPGPNFALVTSTAMGVSRRAALLTATGLAAATFTWVVLAVAGLGILLAQAPWVYVAVKAVGAAYLIWIGVKMLVGARKPLPPAGQQVGVRSAVVKAYVVSMTNPKSFAFYGSILTVMVPVGASSLFYMAVALIAVLVSAAWYGALALLFSHGSARRVFAKAKVGVEATMGALLIGMGGKLLLNR
ncbi:LysE family translocator [Lichenifustis flavocetrariae]|uniref:LysE family transporter n=1 Tax=Lichenifustis flavocetrariae TaxID=2949735 RepID=A0AA41YX24_9HYPH|nr:LysE family transporter [Lichenifustis flavocetrariae]MCW6506415.1 LysE family transporter [Lichenifustis flavocetrariae]